jgi:glycosyltransferase involved in cell wall biosynthesis
MSTTSFVLPVYNAADVLAETLDSILAQSDPDFEVIVVDDGSSDDTPRLLAAYSGRDTRIRVIAQPNTGITRALIAGCAAAGGRYIARHDAGDLSDPRRLERQRAALDLAPDVVLVSCWTAYAGPELEPLWIARSTGVASQPTDVRDLSARYLASDGPPHHGSAMFRRDAYERAGGYRTAFYYGQDWDLWYRLFELGKFQMIEEVLYTARVTAGSISAMAKTAQEEIALHIHDAVRARSRGESDAPFVERASRVRPQRGSSRCGSARGLYFIGEALRRNRDVRCRAYLRRAAFRCPILLRAWLRLAQSIVRL